jgi:hypothetical protein
MPRIFSLIEQTCRALPFPLQEPVATQRLAQEVQPVQLISRIKEITLMDQMLEELVINSLTLDLPHKLSQVIPINRTLLHHKALMSL